MRRASRRATLGLGALRRSFGQRDIANSQELRPADLGRLRKQIEESTTTATWGVSVVNPVADPEEALQFWLKCGFDPLLSLPRVDDVRAVEDYFGTDLSSPDAAMLKESLSFWSAHFQTHWLNVLRLARRKAASQIGSPGDTVAMEDEADKASTTWAEDDEFIRKLSLLREVLQDRPTTLEQIEVAIRRSAPDAFVKLVEAFHSVGTPATFAPVPTTSEYHLEGEALSAWALKFQEARLGAESTRAALRTAVEQNAWPQVAAGLADKLAAVNAVRKARRARQAAAGLLPAWTAMTPAQRVALAESEATRIAQGLITGEFDVEEKNDATEQWLEEHERISKIVDEPIANAEGVTLKKFWLATACVEALEFSHLYTASVFRNAHAKALHRLLAEHTYDEIEAAEVAVLSQSKFDPRSGDVVPNVNNMPEVYCKAHHWRYCGPGVVTQHTDSGARQLLHSYHYLASVPYAIALHYALRPLSSSIDYSTPAKHRQSLIRALVAYSVSVTRNYAAHTNDMLRSLYGLEDELADVSAAIAWPLGVQRRLAQEAIRARAETSDFPVLNVNIAAPTEARTLAERAKYGAVEPVAWLLGSTRTVSFDWAPMTKAQPAVDTNPVAQTLARTAQKRSVGIEITLWRKTQVGKPTEQSAAEAARFQRITGKLQQRPALHQAARHIAWEYSRINGQPAVVPASHVEEVAADGYEFVAVLEDNRMGEFDGKIGVTIPHLRNDVGNEPGKRIEPGTYRLRIRCFQHNVNPAHHPTRASQAFSADFPVVDVLPAALTAFGADTTLAAGKFLDFFESLRNVGLAINTGLEFEAGQSLDLNGDAYTSKIVELIHKAQFAPMGARLGITAMECEIEPRVKAHWLLTHPGASDEEWLCARRFVLLDAVQKERDWWTTDDNLLVRNVSDITQDPLAKEREAADAVSILEAEGHSGEFLATGSIAPAPLVTAAYCGTGVVSRLKIDKEYAHEASLDAVLQQCLSAIDKAHVRHNTLSAQRTSTVERGIKFAVLDTREGEDYGGLHGKTFKYAYKKARESLWTDAGTGGITLGLSHLV